MDLALNNLQRLICHKPNKSTNQPTNQRKSFVNLFLHEYVCLSVYEYLRVCEYIHVCMSKFDYISVRVCARACVCVKKSRKKKIIHIRLIY